MTSWDFFALSAVLLLGVPHGGLDGAIARRNGWPQGLIPWFLFHLSYIFLGTAVALFWWFFPLAGLIGFLFISALHFGASDTADVKAMEPSILPWIAHGGLVCIAIPNLQPTLVEPIFTLLAGANNAELLMSYLAILFIPWSLSLLAYMIFTYKRRQYRKPLINLIVQLILVTLLPPLISFSLYFCFWHSKGHLLRLWRSLAISERRRNLTEAAIYTLMAWLTMGFVFYYFQAAFSETVIKVIFIGLAALTLPHMLLVDYADRRNNMGKK